LQTVERPAGRGTEAGGEHEAVKRYVLLGIVLRILDHDIRVIGASAAKLPRFHESVLRGLQDRVLLEQAALRKRFRETGVKLLEERPSREAVTVKFSARGYHGSLSLPWSQVRAEAERILKCHASR